MRAPFYRSGAQSHCASQKRDRSRRSLRTSFRFADDPEKNESGRAHSPSNCRSPSRHLCSPYSGLPGDAKAREAESRRITRNLDVNFGGRPRTPNQRSEPRRTEREFRGEALRRIPPSAPSPHLSYRHLRDILEICDRCSRTGSRAAARWITAYRRREAPMVAQTDSTHDSNRRRLEAGRRIAPGHIG